MTSSHDNNRSNMKPDYLDRCNIVNDFTDSVRTDNCNIYSNENVPNHVKQEYYINKS